MGNDLVRTYMQWLGHKLLFSQVDYENNIINDNETYPPSKDMENNLLRNKGSF
jgi:hypothetical protein